MDTKKAKRIMRIYNLARILLLVLIYFLIALAVEGQTVDERLALLEKKMEGMEKKHRRDSLWQVYKPQLHGILRGKFEYEPALGASRFEVRNARISVSGALPLRSEYKVEVDLCDESQIKMKDAWVRVNPWSTLRISLGQQRMPFTIDAHRNPSAQYFANRSFIAKQVGDMRDVGAIVGYDFKGKDGRKVLSIDAGVFNGSNLDNQKTAWFSSPAYSARLQYFPVKGLAVIPSVQHQRIASGAAAYTSVDFGAYYEVSGLHIEAEYLRKMYSHGAFSACNAADAMAIYRFPFKKTKAFLLGMSCLLRYDYMGDHSDGKKGVDESGNLQLTDYARHRATAGLTFHVENKYFPTDIRLNYEKYFYRAGITPKESEQDKLVCELMIKF